MTVRDPSEGLYARLASSDHKTIGQLWIATALLLLVPTAVLGVVLGLERVDGVDLFAGTNGYFQMWTLYRFALVLMVAAPLFVGLAIVIVPMQVGASNLAFPRAAAAAGWGYILGAAIVVVSVLAGGGWGALDGVSQGEADAIGLTLMGTGLLIVSLMVAAMCIATTVISLRTKDMTLLRVPLFAWSMLVTAVVWLLTFPVAIANVVLIYADMHGGSLEFGFPEGPDPVIFHQLEWLFLQPQIYAIAIPALGVLGSIVPVVAGIRQVGHQPMMAIIALFGLLGLGGWSQPYFVDNTGDFLFVAFGVVAFVPVLGAVGGAVSTLLQGRAPMFPPAHLLGALAGIALLVLAVLTGTLRVVEQFELSGTTVHTGTVNLVAFAAVSAAVAGLWFWAPRIIGALLGSGIGLMVILALFGGAGLLGTADVVAGFLDASDLMLHDSNEGSVEIMVFVSIVGAVVVAAATLGLWAGIAKAVRNGVQAPADPWNGHTLEWSTAKHPKQSGDLRVVSEAPLLDRRPEAIEVLYEDAR